MNRLIVTGVLYFCAANSAFSHVGHVGELAGHAHWIGVGAIAVAAALAALLAKARQKNSADEVEAESGDEIEAEGEAA